MKKLIGVIDYGAGNLGSVMNALYRLNTEARFVRGPEELAGKSPFEKIIFPGDGHFGTAMRALEKSGYAQAVCEWIDSDKPFLGICIGLQLLFNSSEETLAADKTGSIETCGRGLGVISGTVRRFPGRKIPQIGWNKARPRDGSPLFAALPPDPFFYFIHSYYAEPADDDAVTAAHADYYLSYCCAVERGALSAVQFHPEKSGEAGLQLLSNWITGEKEKNSRGSGVARSKGTECRSEDYGARGSRVENSSQNCESQAHTPIECVPPISLSSLAKRIIPCLDVDDGRVVKGVKFTGIADAGDPVELAKAYNAGGADELTFLDIGASYKSRATLLEVVRQVAREVFIPLCVGGGIRTVDDMRQAMNAGADKVSVCTSALQRPELLAEMADSYGRQCVVLSIDAKRVGFDAAGKAVWHAFSRGGRDDTGIDAIEWAVQAAEWGAGEILLNSIDADGTGAGYDLELTAAVMNTVNVPVIASGGAGTLDQIAAAASVADAALVASLLHFGRTTIQAIKAHCMNRGVCVRNEP